MEADTFCIGTVLSSFVPQVALTGLCSEGVVHGGVRIVEERGIETTDY